MHSGSSNLRDNRRSSRRYTPRHNDDPYNRGAETSESSAAMQPGMSSVSHTFSESSLSYAPPDSQNYAAGDYSQMPTWSTNDYYGFPESHGSTHDYGLGFPSAEGTSSSYFNSAGPSLSYGENVTESSEHHNMYGSDFQSGQNISDAAFDISAFEMPTRTLTQATAPISSADTFDGSTVQPAYGDMLSPQLSPTASRSSRSSFDTNMYQAGSYAEGSRAQSGSSSIQPTSSQLSPDSTKPYRCTQPGCSRSYARKFELYRHQRRHTGVKSHHCQVPGCDRGPNNGFYRKDHLSQHMRQVHGR